MVPHGFWKGQTQLDRAPCGRPRAPEPLVRCVHAQGLVRTAEGSLGAGLALPCGALLPGLMRVKEGMVGWEHFLWSLELARAELQEERASPL